MLPPQRLGGVRCPPPPPPPTPPHVPGLVPSLAGASSTSKQSCRGRGGGTETHRLSLQPPAAPWRWAWAACIIQAHGIFRLPGRGTSCQGWLSCSLTKGPRGLGKLPAPGAGTDVSSQPDPGGGAGCLCHLMDVLIWGGCIIEHMGTFHPDSWTNRLSWWEPHRVRSQGQLVWGARPVWTFGVEATPA